MKMARISVFFTVVALIAGMVGCVGGDADGGSSYTLIIDITAGGTVTVDNLPLPGKAILTYDAGTVVSLNAIPSADYRFVNWTGNATTIDDANAASTTITMNNDYSITANFDYIGPRTVIELDFITFWPSGDFQAKGSIDWYGYTDMGHNAWTDTIAARVLAETDKYEISWNVFYAGTEPAWQIYSLVRDGIYDIGVTAPIYSPGISPLWEGIEYPGDVYRNNAYTMSLTIQAIYDEFIPLQNEMAAQNLKVMHFWSHGPGYFLMTEGSHVETLDDMAALTKPIRAANSASVVTIEALGIEALLCPMSQAIEEFDAGTISGILCPTDMPKGFGLSAYVKHCIFAPFSYQVVFMKVMNAAAWNALPAEVQTIFDEINEAWPEYYGKLRTWGEADGLKYCYDTIPGFTYYDLRQEDPDEYQSWVDATSHLVDEWIGGDATRQALWDKYVELDEYYCTHEPWSSWAPSSNPPEPPSF
jgi:TRAP-type C4-dicarboxylate transport system substrate-binding protein